MHCGTRIVDNGFDSLTERHASLAQRRLTRRAIRQSATRNRRFRAFTTIELLVVVGIIVILLAILIPVMGRIRAIGRQGAISATLGAIQDGIVAYQQDFRDLPPSNARELFDLPNAASGNPPTPLGIPRSTFWTSNTEFWNGGEILAQALVGPLPANASGMVPGDGKNGFGFQATEGRNVGKESTSYYTTKSDRNLRERWDRDGDGGKLSGEIFNTPRPGRYVISTTFSVGMPILYYRANVGAPGTSSDFSNDGMTPTDPDGAVWGSDSDLTDNVPEHRFVVEHNKELEALHPDFPGTAARAHWLNSQTHEEKKNAFARQLRGADYLLYSAGPDDLFGGTPDTEDADLDDIYMTGTSTGGVSY